MGWRTFRRWLAQMHTDREHEAQKSTTRPGSWAGREADSFWGQKRGR